MFNTIHRYRSWIKKSKANWINQKLGPEIQERVEKAVTQLNSVGIDPWGIDPENIKLSLANTLWLYQKYFRVETHNIHLIPQGRVLLVANHGGQLPIDGMLVGLSVLLQGEPPRIVRGMVERWAPTLPFIGSWFAQMGQLVGDVKNCSQLLLNEQAVLVFPEGVQGSGKTIQNRYDLQHFGKGFIRLALETKTPIVPVAVIGCEEAYPSIMKLEKLGKFLKSPYFPLIPTGPIPLPTKVTIRFGEPIDFTELSLPTHEKDLEPLVEKVKQAIQQEIKMGLEIRADRIFTAAAK